MQNIDWNNVQEATSGGKLPAGGYVCGITAVEDVPNMEYLKFEFDIAEGEYKNTYRELYDARGFWAGKFIKSYKESARGYFKKMLTAFEKSNKGFTFNNDEKTLKRKYIGLVIGYEEYVGNDGTTKERLRVADFLPVEDIRSGNFTIPELKKLSSNSTGTQNSTNGFTDVGAVEDDDLPF
ncbi:MAG: hypothetical protein U0L72_00670 [Acutalibacteraceae bacterium]|nr:hypothetical protein [Acutalibacteraceae bacterium]